MDKYTYNLIWLDIKQKEKKTFYHLLAAARIPPHGRFVQQGAEVTWTPSN